MLAPKIFLLTAILAWSGIVAAVWSMHTEEPAPVIAQTESPEFDMRWDDATVLKKQDRLPLLAQPIPNPVEHILRDVPVRVPPIVMSAFKLWHERRLVLMSQKEDPRTYPPLPTTEQIMAGYRYKQNP
jgi:hypothetical protein